MIFRPFKELRQYKQLVELLNRRIGQLQQIEKLHEEQVALLLAQVQTLGRENVKLSQVSEPVKMPLPTVEAVEGLCAAFFEAEPVSIAREAVELTRSYGPVEPQEVLATKRCLMKLWRHYAMQKLEQAAKQNVL